MAGVSLLGHRKWIGDQPKDQTLEVHSRNVAALCHTACQVIGLPSLGFLCGLLHDLGKCDPQTVQPHLRGETPQKANHSAAGSRYLWETFGRGSPSVRLAAQLASTAILWHHSGRGDIFTPDGANAFEERLNGISQDTYEVCTSLFFANCCSEAEIFQLMSKAASEVGALVGRIAKASYINIESLQFSLGLLQRFLFSALVDADWTDTACFMEDRPLPHALPDPERQETWRQICSHVEQFIDGLPQKRPIDLLRSEISQQCRAAVNGHAGIYRLYAPTGSGKTYTMLRYAVHQAMAQNTHHIFYFAPYKSILKQNTGDFRSAIGNSKWVLEHHSDVIAAEKDDLLLAQTQRWQGAFLISTTMVQFLNTLYSAPRQSVRRMAALAGSVLLFDEIQSLPAQDTYLFNLTLNLLAHFFGCTIVLCTATQPALDQVSHPICFSSPKDLLPNYDLRFAQLKRTNVLVLRTPGGHTASALADQIIKLLKENSSLLLILNTKSAVAKVFSALLPMLGCEAEIYCLTTNLCAKHRETILDSIRDFQSKNLPHRKLICISTQLIEAGVDLSFDCVIRSMAGLPSVAQAAGRCNRHGEASCRNVYLVDCAEEDLRYLPEIETARLATLALLDQLPSTADLLSPETILQYYHCYYQGVDRGHAQDHLMRYPLPHPKGATMLDLLGTNLQGRRSWQESGHPAVAALELAQAFETAESQFQAIPDETMPVLVPYQEGKQLISELLSANAACHLPELLQKAQPYIVSVHHSQFQRLERQGALLPLLNGSIVALKDGHYDPTLGVQFQQMPDKPLLC